MKKQITIWRRWWVALRGTTWHYVALRGTTSTATHNSLRCLHRAENCFPQSHLQRTRPNQVEVRHQEGEFVLATLPHCHIATFPGCIEITSVTIAESKLCYIFFVDKRDSYTFCKMNWGSNKHHRAKSPWLYQQKWCSSFASKIRKSPLSPLAWRST